MAHFGRARNAKGRNAAAGYGGVFEPLIESFEHDNLSGLYTGDLSPYTIIDDPTGNNPDGSKVLEFDTTGSGERIRRSDLSSGDGATYRFWSYGQSNYECRFHWMIDPNGAFNGDSYGIEHDYEGDRINFRILGSDTAGQNVSGGIPQDEWVYSDVQHETNGTMTQTLYDSSDTQLEQTSTTDTTLTSGEIGWYCNHGAGGGGIGYMDYAREV